jgi:hypothetical protein
MKDDLVSKSQAIEALDAERKQCESSSVPQYDLGLRLAVNIIAALPAIPLDATELRDILDQIIHHKIGVDPLEGEQAACVHNWKWHGDDDECLNCGTFYTPVIVTQFRDFILEAVRALPVLETPAEAVFCDHSQWRECAATLEMVRDLSDKALNYTAAYDLANDLAAILAGYDDAIPGAPVEPVPAPRLECRTPHDRQIVWFWGDRPPRSITGFVWPSAKHCPTCGAVLSATPKADG